MKGRILLRLILSLLAIAAFVLAATILEASNSLNPTAWWWAQRQLHLLWLVDGLAVLVLLSVIGSAVLQNRLAYVSEESARERDSHQTQLEDMIRNAEETDRIQSEQSVQLVTLQETIAALDAKLQTLEAETQAAQQTLAEDARRLAEQAFAALMGQMDANTRQMEAVSLAMQYQRAEIKQLRQGVRAVQHQQDIHDTARLTPGERAALEGEDTPLLLSAGNSEEAEEKRRRREEEKEQNFSLPLEPAVPAPGFFEPTMNAATTFVTPTTDYEIAPMRGNSEPDSNATGELNAAGNVEDSPQSVDSVSRREAISPLPTPAAAHAASPEDTFIELTAPAASEHETISSKSVLPMTEEFPPAADLPQTTEQAITPEEYQLLLGQSADTSSEQPLSPANDTAQTPPQSGPRRWFMRL